MKIKQEEATVLKMPFRRNRTSPSEQAGGWRPSVRLRWTAGAVGLTTQEKRPPNAAEIMLDTNYGSHWSRAAGYIKHRWLWGSAPPGLGDFVS